MEDTNLNDVIVTFLLMSYREGETNVEWSEDTALKRAETIVQCVQNTQPKSYRWRASD